MLVSLLPSTWGRQASRISPGGPSISPGESCLHFAHAHKLCKRKTRTIYEYNIYISHPARYKYCSTWTQLLDLMCNCNCCRFACYCCPTLRCVSVFSSKATQNSFQASATARQVQQQQASPKLHPKLPLSPLPYPHPPLPPAVPHLVYVLLLPRTFAASSVRSPPTVRGTKTSSSQLHMWASCHCV